MGELDYNLHKSNATYLTDLDIARGYHVYCLFRVGFKKFSTGAERRKGMFFPALGGVTLTFKREIKPYQKYDIWTRVLSWDSKWVYFVSHFVNAGSVKPTTFMDHPWRNKTPSTTRSQEQSSASAPTATTPQVIIYTTCISKYAMKQGRKTIPPVEFLQACGLLPKITDETSVSGPSKAGEGSTLKLGKQLSAHKTTPNPEFGLLDTIEKRRREGLGVAEHVAGLDQSFDWFRGDEDTVFAYY
jgi:Thioesterase-like superfamily